MLVLHYRFEEKSRESVMKVRRKKNEGLALKLPSEAHSWLESFLSIGEISPRGKINIIDVVTTAAIIDNYNQIEATHIVEAAECRLFDRPSWISSINDTSIPEYNCTDCIKFDSWINEVSAP